MNEIDSSAARVVYAALTKSHVDWTALCSSSTQIILFGSTACGLNRLHSDVDLLCIGQGERMRRRFVDIKWLSPEKIQSRQWFESELAIHIARFGKWMHGCDDWTSRVQITSRTLGFKQWLLRGRLKGLRNRWALLSVPYRIKHVVKIRRDFQRLALMLCGDAVWPTPALDYMWSSVKEKRSALIDLVHFTRADELLDYRDVDTFGDLLRSSFLPDASQTFVAAVKRWTSDYLEQTSDAKYECLTAWLQKHAWTTLQSSEGVDAQAHRRKGKLGRDGAAAIC